MGALIVRDFPPSMAALARMTSEGWADRCELYWEGLEIANGFNEVNDPIEQKKRWQNDIEERRRLGTSIVPVDPSLIRALEVGMPPTGGIALGMERLYMACRGVDEIRELKLFATAAPTTPVVENMTENQILDGRRPGHFGASAEASVART